MGGALIVSSDDVALAILIVETGEVAVVHGGALEKGAIFCDRFSRGRCCLHSLDV